MLDFIDYTMSPSILRKHDISWGFLVHYLVHCWQLFWATMLLIPMLILVMTRRPHQLSPFFLGHLTS